MNWYCSTVPKEWIVRISMNTELPSMDWDEQWWAEDLSAHCARWGSHLFLAGEKIPVQSGLFEGFLSVKKIQGLELLDASASEDISRVFAGCRSLKEADLSAWNLSAVITTEGLFDGCVSLECADLSTWDLSSCRSIASMFRECNHLRSLDVSTWNLGQVQDFSNAFSCCYDLKSLDVSQWNTSSAQTMEGLFNRCRSLTELDVSQWNVEQVTNCRFLFHRCENLKKLDLKQWSLRKDADCDRMFLRMFGTIRLPRQRRFRTLLPRDQWVKGHRRLGKMFHITSVELSKKIESTQWIDDCWTVDEAKSGFLFCLKQGDRLRICSRGGKIYSNEDSSMLFCFPDEKGNSWLQTIDGLDLLNTRYTHDFSFMFSGNSGLLHLDVSKFDFSSAKNLSGMFLNCRKLQKLDRSGWQIPSDAEQQGMYQGCESLDGLRILK